MAPAESHLMGSEDFGKGAQPLPTCGLGGGSMEYSALKSPEVASHWLNPMETRGLMGSMEAMLLGPRETEVEGGFARVNGNHPVYIRSFAGQCKMAGGRGPCVSSTLCPWPAFSQASHIFSYLVSGFDQIEFGDFSTSFPVKHHIYLNREMLVSRV